MTQQDWQIYFSRLASEHKQLLHRSDDRHFFRGELDEFFDGFRAKVRYPALIMESTIIDQYGDSHNRQQRRTLAYMVVDNVTRDDHDDIASALARCETIGMDIAGRLQYDAAHDSALSRVSVTDVHAEPMVNEPSHYVGWRFEVVVEEQNTGCFDKTKWQRNADNHD